MELKTLRLIAKLTQAELSSRTKLSTRIISQYENGKKLPGYYSIIALCDAIGCTADELLGRKPITMKRKGGE